MQVQIHGNLHFHHDKITTKSLRQRGENPLPQNFVRCMNCNLTDHNGCGCVYKPPPSASCL